MVLGDRYIRNVDLGLTAQDKVNPASVDLAIGNKITLVTFGGYKNKSVIERGDDDPYRQMVVDANRYEPIIRHIDLDLDEFPNGIWVRPGVGVLCSTVADLRIPKDVVGQVLLKSSRGREFYQSCMAGYFDNGFHGQGTLEIYAPVIPIFLQTGLKIVQMRFDELTEYEMTYQTQPDAKYAGQKGPTASRDHRW